MSTTDFINSKARSSEVPEFVKEEEDIRSESKRMLNRLLANQEPGQADFFGKGPRRGITPVPLEPGASVTRPSEVLKSFSSGVLGLDTGKGTEAYRTGQALANMPPAAAAALLYGAASPFAIASTMARRGQMMGVSPLNVFTGSPHRYTKLDSSKIGTGEGTQVYGYGLYFAENPKVARTYASPERTYKRVSGHLSPLQERISDAIDQGIDATTLFSHLSSIGYKIPKNNFATPYDAFLEEWQNVKKMDTGSVYKIDLPDQMIDRMIDWDKPLREQSKVIQELAKQFNISLDDLGGDLVFRSGAKKREGADLLRQAGIPGVKYLDRGSRGVGKGTRNFVVFPGEEEALTILDVKAKGGEVSINDFINAKARSLEIPDSVDVSRKTSAPKKLLDTLSRTSQRKRT
jgi:hypothetical protein